MDVAQQLESLNAPFAAASAASAVTTASAAAAATKRKRGATDLVERGTKRRKDNVGMPLDMTQISELSGENANLSGSGQVQFGGQSGTAVLLAEYGIDPTLAREDAGSSERGYVEPQFVLSPEDQKDTKFAFSPALKVGHMSQILARLSKIFKGGTTYATIIDTEEYRGMEISGFNAVGEVLYVTIRISGSTFVIPSLSSRDGPIDLHGKMPVYINMSILSDSLGPDKNASFTITQKISERSTDDSTHFDPSVDIAPIVVRSEGTERIGTCSFRTSMTVDELQSFMPPSEVFAGIETIQVMIQQSTIADDLSSFDKQGGISMQLVLEKSPDGQYVFMTLGCKFQHESIMDSVSFYCYRVSDMADGKVSRLDANKVRSQYNELNLFYKSNFAVKFFLDALKIFDKGFVQIMIGAHQDSNEPPHPLYMSQRDTGTTTHFGVFIMPSMVDSNE